MIRLLALTFLVAIHSKMVSAQEGAPSVDELFEKAVEIKRQNNQTNYELNDQSIDFGFYEFRGMSRLLELRPELKGNADEIIRRLREETSMRDDLSSRAGLAFVLYGPYFKNFLYLSPENIKFFYARVMEASTYAMDKDDTSCMFLTLSTWYAGLPAIDQSNEYEEEWEALIDELVDIHDNVDALAKSDNGVSMDPSTSYLIPTLPRSEIVQVSAEYGGSIKIMCAMNAGLKKTVLADDESIRREQIELGIAR